MRVVGVHYSRWSSLVYDPSLFVSKARALGYDQLEIDAPSLLAMSNLGRTRLGFEARTHQMDISYTWTPSATYNLASLDEEARKAALTYATSLVRTIGAMGGGLFNVPFYASLPPSGDAYHRPKVALNQAVKSLKSLASVASEEMVVLNVKLLKSTTHPLLTSVSEALSFLQAVNEPRIGLDLDTYYLHSDGHDVPEAIKEAGYALKCLHVREADGSRVGSGSFDWLTIRESFDAIRYSGPVIHNPIVKEAVVERPYESNRIRKLLVEPLEEQ